MAHEGDEMALDIASPVLKMFLTLLEHSGSLTADADDEHEHVTSTLSIVATRDRRAQASVGLPLGKSSFNDSQYSIINLDESHGRTVR